MKTLDKKFKRTLLEERRFKIRNNLNPKNQKSFWKAVNLANSKPMNDTLPNIITCGQQKARDDQHKSNIFPDYFRTKLEKLKSQNDP